jgi:hypothetical protein
MSDTDGRFSDDVPVADAVEQQRPTADSPATVLVAADLPLEPAVSDWQEQPEPVDVDPEFGDSE